MGRGRQKAKQTKVARRLKYFSPETDYDALQRELASSGPDEHTSYAADDASDEPDDGDSYSEDGRYADWSPSRRH